MLASFHTTNPLPLSFAPPSYSGLCHSLTTTPHTAFIESPRFAYLVNVDGRPVASAQIDVHHENDGTPVRPTPSATARVVVAPITAPPRWHINPRARRPCRRPGPPLSGGHLGLDIAPLILSAPALSLATNLTLAAFAPARCWGS